MVEVGDGLDPVVGDAEVCQSAEGGQAIDLSYLVACSASAVGPISRGNENIPKLRKTFTMEAYSNH